MIRGVHHVSFGVSDMDRSLKFYVEGLGFRLISDRTVRGPFPEKGVCPTHPTAVRPPRGTFCHELTSRDT